MRALVFSVICVMTACGAPATPIDAAGQIGSSFGRVTVQVAHDHDSGEVHTQAHALFVRWRGLSEATIAQLLALPGWGTEELSPGECKVFDQAQAMGDAAGGVRADIQLLDAGDINVKTPTTVLSFLPKRYPDVLPTLSGFQYETQGDLIAGSEWVVQSGGGEEIGFFAAGTPAPAEVRLSRVGPHYAAPGIVWRRARDLVVQIDATAADGLTYVELATGSAHDDAQVAVRCRAGLAGAVVVPALLLSELPAGDATLSAVHAAWKPLRGGRGLARGELWVEYRDELAVGLR